MIVASSPASRVYVNTDLVDALFAGGGLTTDLVEILKVLMKHVPDVRGHIQVTPPPRAPLLPQSASLTPHAPPPTLCFCCRKTCVRT